MTAVDYQDTREVRQGRSQRPDADLVHLATIELRGHQRKFTAYLQLLGLAGADGVALLTGGVRGWAQALGCSPSWPRQLLCDLEERGLIGVEYYPGDGGLVAEVDLSPGRTRSVIESSPPEPAEGKDCEAHQDAERGAADSISDRSPPTPPHVDDHESMQQQQHDRACVRGVAEPDRTNLTELLLREFPDADRALLAVWGADPHVNFRSERDDEPAALRALRGFPSATLADWHADLTAAAERPTIGWPVGAVLAAWSRRERITPRRAAPVRPSPLADRIKKRREEFDPDEVRAQIARRGGVASPAPDELARASPPAAPPGQRSDPTLRQRWQAVLGAIAPQVPREDLAWLRQLIPEALEAGEATFRAPSPTVEMGVHRYLDTIRHALGDVVGYPVTVRIIGRQAVAVAAD